MNKLIFAFAIALLSFRCTNKKGDSTISDKRIPLTTDTVNVVKMTDTLVIFESTCRGCAMEGSTHFDISDSMNIVKISAIRTIDNNPPDMSGGNVSKQIELVPLKTGTTTFKLYKFWDEKETADDSALAQKYTIEVRN